MTAPATVIGQRVNDHDRVFARFDNFVEIADRAIANCGSQRTVVPDRFLAFEQKTADQIGRRKIFMTRDGDQRAFESPRHVLDKASLAAAGRAFENDRQIARSARLRRDPPPGRRADNTAQLLLDSPELRFLAFIGILTFERKATKTVLAANLNG